MTKLLLTAMLAVASTPAFAQDARTVRIAHADLRLERQADLAELDRRIGRAARAACGDASDADLHGRNGLPRCRAEARASAAAVRDRLVERARRVATR